MKHAICGAGLLFLAGCQPGLAPLGGAGGGGTFREFLVIGSSMPFEQCRARGGLIIRDNGSPMVACDPSVRGEPVPPDEFDHPDSQAAAAAAQTADQG